MVRMRTIKDTIKFFQAQDPDTGMTEYTLRRMISSGQVSTLKVGTKHLINLDALLETLEKSGVFTPITS